LVCVILQITNCIPNKSITKGKFILASARALQFINIYIKIETQIKIHAITQECIQISEEMINFYSFLKLLKFKIYFKKVKNFY